MENQEQAPYKVRREIRPSDADAIRQIVESTGYFRSDEVDVAVELAWERLQEGDASGYFFLFIDRADQAVAFCCLGPIPCTIGSFDLYWIAVHNDCRRQGLGRVLLREAEQLVATMKGRKLYIETSSKPGYDDTRAFYSANGYHHACTLQDFYAPSDDKITFAKDI